MSSRFYVAVTVDAAPTSDGPDFEAWCEKWGMDRLNGGRRAWWSAGSTYLRDAYGVAETESGETFLVYRDELRWIIPS